MYIPLTAKASSPLPFSSCCMALLPLHHPQQTQRGSAAAAAAAEQAFRGTSLRAPSLSIRLLQTCGSIGKKNALANLFC
jgi:hypothetical protein